MPGMFGSLNRRQPYPYDIYINGVGYMLDRGQDGIKDLNAQHPNPLQGAAPSEFSYSAQNPFVEATTTFKRLHLGFGEGVQKRTGDQRYRYASGVDCSIEDCTTLGPYLNTVTPSGSLDTTNGISHFFEIGGDLYALNGRYVLKRTADTAAGWSTVSKDFGVGKVARDVIVHRQNGASTTYAYVAMGDSEFMYRFDGTTWTQHASMYALCFAVAGRELYRGVSTNKAAKVDSNSDPWTAANWTADNAFYAGDSSSAIVRMTTNASGILVIFKTDGIYVLDENGQDMQLYRGMRFIPNNSDNGKFHWLDNDMLHVTFGGQHYEIGPDMTLDQTGPELFSDNNSPVHGYITAGVGTPYCSYAGLYNPDSGHSFLMQYGSYGRGEQGNPLDRNDVWHGSLSRVGTGGASGDSTNDMASRKVTAMHLTSIGAPSAHQQVYIGYSNGDITNFILSCTPNQTGCSSYKYSDGSNAKSGWLYLPYWHGGFPTVAKAIRAVTCSVQSASATSLINSFQYRTAGGGGAYTSVPTGGGTFVTAVPGARAAIGTGQTQTDFCAELKNTASATATASPVMSALAVHYAVNPPLQLAVDIEILAEDNVLRRDGVMVRRGVSAMKTALRTAVATTAGVSVIMPSEETLTMQLKNYREETRWDEVQRKYRQVIVVTGVQSDVNSGSAVVVLS